LFSRKQIKKDIAKFEKFKESEKERLISDFMKDYVSKDSKLMVRYSEPGEETNN